MITIRLNHYTFQILDPKTGRETSVHHFAVRPESYEEEWVARDAVQQTLGGAWVDSYGLGLKRIILSGTTGYKYRWHGVKHLSGYEAFKNLYDEVYRNSKLYDSTTNTLATANFYCWNTEDKLVVDIMSFRFQYSKSFNFMFRYRIEMIALREITDEVLSKDPLLRTFQLMDRYVGDTAAQFIKFVEYADIITEQLYGVPISQLDTLSMYLSDISSALRTAVIPSWV